jgi:acyl-CoA reductase-like NAD-dependent aldehyde dehydrogenase
MAAQENAPVRVLQNFINGEYVDPVRGTNVEYIEVTTPHTGEPIARCPLSNVEDVDHAVQVAKAAFKLWR